jgi:hypothetical protein
MTSILRRTQKSKLQNLNPSQTEKIFPVSRKSSSAVKSFRFDPQSWQDLQAMVEKINNISKRKISTSRLVKALVYLGKTRQEKELLKVLKEIAI